ncbi:FAD:protein FMN transferase [bacterium]|nr:FAD:protein FMN transferase [bacterium]
MFVRAGLIAVLVYAIPSVPARPAPPAAPARFEFESKHMGTTFRVVLYAADEKAAKAAADAGFARVAALDRCMSDYNRDSELMKLCAAFRTEVGPPVPVSDDLFAVLWQARELARRSDGAFDVTVGPVVQLWRHARRTQQLPDKDELAAAMRKVGWRNVELDPVRQTARLLVPGMQLDLGGIAKGYAADAVLALLRQRHGIRQALVAAAGDITCGDPPPGRDHWEVDVAPIARGQEPRHLRLANAAVSTSGDLEQFVEIGGVRYSHIVDPRTGLGVTGRRSVTVIAPRGVTADSMTKAVTLMPAGRGLELVEASPGAAAFIAVVGPNEAVQRTESRRFGSFVAQ